MGKRTRRLAATIAAALLAVVIGLAVTLALPVATWRTGELPAAPLPVVQGGPPVALAPRVWIDTDAACGEGRRVDPDDCLALLLLVRTRAQAIAGVSTVFGNAPLAATDRVTRELVARSGLPVPVHRGAAAPGNGATPASEALRTALADAPLTLVALGPLTNVAAALRGRPDLQARVARLIVVMGRRPGHLFHPAEGAPAGLLLGHGPVFRDFNYAMDPEAAADVVAMGLPLTLLPYEAARTLSVEAADLDRMTSAGGAAAWVAARSRSWLDYWAHDIGRPGFYPFDLLAAAYVVDSRQLDCASALAWVGPDERLWSLPFQNREALLVGIAAERTGKVRASTPAIYCVRTRPALHDAALAALSR